MGQIALILQKIILYVSSNALESIYSSDNYIELLNCNSDKTGLLLINSVAARECNLFIIQPNLILNLTRMKK